jgi:hypothetical protein
VGYSHGWRAALARRDHLAISQRINDLNRATNHEIARPLSARQLRPGADLLVVNAGQMLVPEQREARRGAPIRWLNQFVGDAGASP